VTFVVGQNIGPERGGSIRIGGRKVAISQKGRRSKGPKNLTASVSGSTVTLRWEPPDPADPGDAPEIPQSYVVEAGSYPGASNILPGFVTGSLATGLTATNVPRGTYHVRAKVQYPGYRSEPSNEVVVVVGGSGCSAPPGEPSGLAYTVAGRVVTLTWNPSSGPVTSYVISAGPAQGHFTFRGDTGSSASKLVAAVQKGTYYVRVQGKNACGVGPGADVVVVVP
jgi:hypothetical protein